MRNYIRERLAKKVRTEATDESMSMDAEMDLKQVIAQLAVSMKAMGLDPSNKDDALKFADVLKLLGGTKKQTFLTKVGAVTDVKQMKAVKAAKASL